MPKYRVFDPDWDENSAGGMEITAPTSQAAAKFWIGLQLYILENDFDGCSAIVVGEGGQRLHFSCEIEFDPEEAKGW